MTHAREQSESVSVGQSCSPQWTKENFTRMFVRRSRHTSTERKHPRVWMALAATMSVLLSLGVVPLTASPADAKTNVCPKFIYWQDWLGGVRWHASISFRASDLCEGRHVKRAAVRLYRECWPSMDSGMVWTSDATSVNDTAVRTVSIVRFDSLVPGCNTRKAFMYNYFA